MINHTDTHRYSEGAKMINHADTHRYTPRTMAIHKKGDSPCSTDVYIGIDTNDEGETHYFTIYSEGRHIHLDIEELAQLYPAAINLLHGVPSDGSTR